MLTDRGHFFNLTLVLLRCRVYPTAMRQQCSRPNIGAEGCYKASDGSIYHTVFVRGFATISVATHLTLTYGFPDVISIFHTRLHAQWTLLPKCQNLSD